MQHFQIIILMIRNRSKIAPLINVNRSFYLLLGLSLFFIQGCSSSKNKIQGVPISDFFSKCESYNKDFGDLITLGDPNNRFMITLPYSWDIREFYTDTLYGVYASNAMAEVNKPEQFYSLSLTGYESELGLKDYYNKELSILIKDQNTEVWETGSLEIDSKQYPWVLFMIEGELPIINQVTYIKSEGSSSIYLIQVSVFQEENSRERICEINQFVSSFELIK